MRTAAALTPSGTPTFTSSRCQLDSSDRIQAPNSLLDETQGWMAFRVRMGFAWNGGTAAPRLFEWADGANGDLQAAYDTSADRWYMYRDSPGGAAEADSAVQSFAAGDDVTVIVAWRADRIGINVNGGAFVWNTAAQFIPVLAGTLDIGNSPGANRSIASDYHWVLAGSGIVDAPEAAAIHAFGNSDPAVESIPGVPVFLWTCDSLSYFLYTVASFGMTALPSAQIYPPLYPGPAEYPGSDVYPAGVPALQLTTAATLPLTLTEP